MNRWLRFAGLGLVAAALLVLWLIPALHGGQERAAAPAAPAPVPAKAAEPEAEPEPAAAAAPRDPAPSANAESPPPSAPAPAVPAAPPRSTIRIAFESEARDATAPATEARIRDIYADEPLAQGILREVRCTQTVCKIDARWSAQLNRGYNAALMQVIREFTRDLSFEPNGPLHGQVNEVTIYVRRPAHPAPEPGAGVEKKAEPAP